MSNKVIVSVDVEDWYHGPTVISPKNSSKTLESFLASADDAERAYRYIGSCLDLLAAHNIKATFFWVAEYARRFEDLIREVVAQGHEVACHGLCHYSKLDAATRRNVFSEKEFVARTREAKEILENLSGQRVIGYRAPNAYISGMMIDVLEDLGFRYDSSVSVNSLYNKTDGELCGVDTAPYYPRRGSLDRGTEKRRIVEFPWPYLDVMGFKVQSAGGPFLRMFGTPLIKGGIRQSLRRGQTTFYFHPVDICNEPIPLEFDLRRPLLWMVKGDVVKRRIACLLADFAPMTANFASVVDEVVPK